MPLSIECQITPLGAAIAEALPSRKKAAAIQRNFKHKAYLSNIANFQIR